MPERCSSEGKSVQERILDQQQAISKDLKDMSIILERNTTMTEEINRQLESFSRSTAIQFSTLTENLDELDNRIVGIEKTVFLHDQHIKEECPNQKGRISEVRESFAKKLNLLREQSQESCDDISQINLRLMYIKGLIFGAWFVIGILCTIAAFLINKFS